MIVRMDGSNQVSQAIALAHPPTHPPTPYASTLRAGFIQSIHQSTVNQLPPPHRTYLRAVHNQPIIYTPTNHLHTHLPGRRGSWRGLRRARQSIHPSIHQSINQINQPPNPTINQPTNQSTNHLHIHPYLEGGVHGLRGAHGDDGLGGPDVPRAEEELPAVFFLGRRVCVCVCVVCVVCVCVCVCVCVPLSRYHHDST